MRWDSLFVSLINFLFESSEHRLGWVQVRILFLVKRGGWTPTRRQIIILLATTILVMIIIMTE